MEVNKKSPDRVYIDKAINSSVVKAIDDKKFLALDIATTSRMELFLFAMTLGIPVCKTPLDSQESFVLEQSIKNHHKSLMYSNFISNLAGDSNLEEVIDKEKVYCDAQQYANTGFQVIREMMKNKSPSVVELELFNGLDEMYKKYIG